MKPSSKLYIGMLSGTSLDAIDVAIVDFNDDRPKLLASLAYPLPEMFKQQCLAISQTGQCNIDQLGMLDHQAGKLFADAALEILHITGLNASQIEAIGCHGQNIRHRPDVQFPFTMQIADPNLIAGITKITTVADLRRKDLAFGGQGAPLAPGFHREVFSSNSVDRAIINIGGISNISILPKEHQQVIGFDIGPGNCLLDLYTQKFFNQPFDRNGEIAGTGKIVPELLSQLLDEPYFNLDPPKSTGRELFNWQWLESKITSHSAREQDILATLNQFTVNAITKDIKKYCQANTEVYLCGGGAYNTRLIELLNQKLNDYTSKISTTDELGIAPAWVEACLMAWIAKKSISKQSANIPSVTGASEETVLGGVYY